MQNKPQGMERRQFFRVKKHYIIRFFQKDNPSLKYDASQIENISKGGMCFSSILPFAVGDLLAFELRTPYVSEKVYLEGRILESREVIKGVVYQNRVKFESISSQATDILEKIEKYNIDKGA